MHTHGRLTGDQIRRLLFRKAGGDLVSRQAVNTRLRKLVELGCLDPVVVNSGRGAGPYAYGLAPKGSALLRGLAVARRRGAAGPVWHQLEVAELRVRLQQALEVAGGKLIEWLSEPTLRSLLLARSGSPIPDALVHWRLPRREGTFMLEWDRGTESLAVLTAKIRRYATYWRSRGHRELVPGLGLRPRLAVVVQSMERRERLCTWLSAHRTPWQHNTILVGLADEVLSEPLGASWWRSDSGDLGTLHE